MRILALVCVLALSAPAAAKADDYKGDLDVAAHLFNKVRNRGVTSTYKGGWHVGTSYRVLHVVSMIAEFSGDYRKCPGYTANIYAYSGGVRFQSGTKGERVKPFAQILMGGAQDNGTGDGTINHYVVVTPGGGVDVGLGRHVAARLKLDFPLYMTFGDVLKGQRLSLGVSVPLGTR